MCACTCTYVASEGEGRVRKNDDTYMDSLLLRFPGLQSHNNYSYI